MIVLEQGDMFVTRNNEEWEEKYRGVTLTVESSTDTNVVAIGFDWSPGEIDWTKTKTLNGK